MSSTANMPTAAVTGGASGLGLAFARHWVNQGGRVVLLDKSADAVRRAAEELGECARAVAADVTDSSNLEHAFADIEQHEAVVDVLVNSAGIASPAPSRDMTDQEFTDVLDTHLTGTFLSCRRAFPLLQKSDRAAIVNVASVAAAVGMPERANYTAAKAGIAGLSRTLAVEWATSGIRVNAVGPGYVLTALTQTLIDEGRLHVEGIEERTPLGRFAEPEEVVEAMSFLASAQSSYVTGHLLMVDGGLTIQGDWY